MESIASQKEKKDVTFELLEKYFHSTGKMLESLVKACRGEQGKDE